MKKTSTGVRHRGRALSINLEKVLAVPRTLTYLSILEEFSYFENYGANPGRRASRPYVALLGSGAPAGTTPTLVATTRQHGFRVIVIETEPQSGVLALPQDALDALACDAGAPVRVLPLHP